MAAKKKAPARAAKTVRALTPKIMTGEITVDYSRPLEAMIDAAEFSWVGSGFTRPPWVVSGSGTPAFAVSVLSFDDDASSPDVVAAMEEQGLRPATIAELVAFAATEKKLAPVVGLGSAIIGSGWNPLVPVLSRWRENRYLVNGGWHAPWLAGTKFLAVAKDAAAGLGKIAHNHFLVPGPKLKVPQWDFPPPATRVYPVEVDASVSRAALLKSAKLRDRLEDIDALFVASKVPPLRTGHVEMRVISFNRELGEGEIADELDAMGLAPAGTFELLCFSAQHPDVQREHQIVASGESFEGDLFLEIATIEGRTLMTAKRGPGPFKHDLSFLAVPKR